MTLSTFGVTVDIELETSIMLAIAKKIYELDPVGRPHGAVLKQLAGELFNDLIPAFELLREIVRDQMDSPGGAEPEEKSEYHDKLAEIYVKWREGLRFAFNPGSAEDEIENWLSGIYYADAIHVISIQVSTGEFLGGGSKTPWPP